MAGEGDKIEVPRGPPGARESCPSAGEWAREVGRRCRCHQSTDWGGGGRAPGEKPSEGPRVPNHRDAVGSSSVC